MSHAIFAANWSFGEKAVQAAAAHWAGRPAGRPHLLDAAIAGAASAESDLEVFTVGKGGMPNALGEVELDAAVMEGERMDAGAVAGVRGFACPSALAREVMLHSPHVLLVGEGATRFALARGFHQENLLTEEALREWRKHQNLLPTYDPSAGSESNHDTIGVLGCFEGHLVAVCSTSGLAGKLPGRVGDSPLVGAGLFADNEAGAAVATGIGEHILRSALSVRIVDRMRAGAGPQEACDDVLHHLVRRRPECAEMMIAVMAMSPHGEVGTRALVQGYCAFTAQAGVVTKIGETPLPAR